MYLTHGTRTIRHAALSTLRGSRRLPPGQLATYQGLKEYEDLSFDPAWTASRVRTELAGLPHLQHLHLMFYEPEGSVTRLKEFGLLPSLTSLRLEFNDPWTPVSVYLHSSLVCLSKLELGDRCIGDFARVGDHPCTSAHLP